jgi:Bacterial regulatory proteins, luxR family
MTNPPTLKKLYEEAIETMRAMFPDGTDVQGTIPEATQQQVLSQFKPMLKHRMFYFVMDLTNQQIIHQHGISEQLGYHSFDLYQYLQAIPIPVLQMINHVAISTFNAIATDPTLAKFMDKSLTVDLPLRRSDGKYVLTQKSMYVLDVCPKGRVLKHLNLYTVIKEIDEKGTVIPLSPQIQSEQMLNITHLEEELKKLLESRFNKEKILRFTTAQKEVLDAVAQGMSNKEIMDYLGMAEGTVKAHKNQILRLAKNYFGDTIPVKNVEDLLYFFKHNKIAI